MIFLDNASTTKVHSDVLKVFNTYAEEKFYNPSAMYGEGFEVSKDINIARKNLITRLGGRSIDNLIYTSCATESNNMVLRSFVKKNSRALVSMGEHPSVYNVAIDLKNNGYDIEFINLTKQGTVDFNDFRKKMTREVGFVSVIHVNNETGAINDIKSLVKIAKSVNPKVIFHSDGVQAFGKIDVNVTNLGVDLYTISGHKIYAPKGIGALYVKDSKHVKPLILGGGQEFDLRSGTENTAGIMALDKASEIVLQNRVFNYENISKISQYVRENVEDGYIISDENCSPYIIMVAFAGCRAETILHMMEEEGFLIGNGSACSSKRKENRNLKSMGYGDDIAEGAIRVSFSIETKLDELKSFVEILNKAVKEYKRKVGI